MLFAEATHWRSTVGCKRESSSFTPASEVSKMMTCFSDPTYRVTEMKPPLMSSLCDPSHGSPHGVEYLALGRRYLPYFSLWLHPALSEMPLQVSWLSTLLTGAGHSSSPMLQYPVLLFLTSTYAPIPSLPFIPSSNTFLFPSSVGFSTDEDPSIQHCQKLQPMP